MQVIRRTARPEGPEPSRSAAAAGDQRKADRTGRAGRADRMDRAGVLVVTGSLVTMVGLIGDLLVHATGAGEDLFVAGATNPWALVVFAGIVITSLGGILWAARLSGDHGALIGTALVLVLASVVIVGAWSGVRAHTGSGGVTLAAAAPGAGAAAGGTVAGGAAVGSSLQGIHDHGAAGSVGAVAGEGTGSEGQARFGGHSHGAPGPISDQEARSTVAMLARAKVATARFRSLAYAESHGYQQVTQFIPGLGLHLANLTLLNAGFDPVHPPILLYEPTNAGGERLVGVAYSVPASANPPIGFPGGEDVWHYHTNLCFLPSGDVTITPNAAGCTAKHGAFQARTAWLLHAWIWKQNPKGVFTEENPLVF